MTALFLQGNSRDVLKNLPADYFHCVTTSPPYFGLRRYDGGVEDWGDWVGQLGGEPSPEMFVAHLIQIMREVRRVLRPDGVFWLNIGSSYSSVNTNVADSLYGINKESSLAFRVPVTLGVTAHSLDVSFDNEFSPDDVLLSLLGVKRVVIKQRDNHFSQVFNVLATPCYLRVSKRLNPSFNTVDNTDLNIVFDEVNGVSIIVSQGNSYGEAQVSSIRSIVPAISDSEMSRHTSFPIEESCEPVPEVAGNVESDGQSVLPNFIPERFPDVYFVDNSVPLPERLRVNSSHVSNLRVTKATREEFAFRSHSGRVNFSAVFVSQPYLLSSDGVLPYDIIHERAIQVKSSRVPLQDLSIPERLKLSAQEDGWICRSTLIWAKGVSLSDEYNGNPMPESVNGTRWERHRVSRCPQCGAYSSFRRRICKECGWRKPANRGETAAWRAETGQQERDSDGGFASDSFYIDCPGCPKCEKNGGYVLRKGSWRPTDSYEHILMLTKTSHYFCDREAVLEQNVSNQPRTTMNGDGNGELGSYGHFGQGGGSSGRNLRSVLLVPTTGYKGAHFAVYNPKLIEPLIRSATSEKGCCPKCGAPWARVIDKGFTAHDGDTATEYVEGTNANRLALLRQAARQRGTEYGRLSYNSKYKGGDVTGLATQGFQRNETIEGERSRSRVDAERLFPNDKRAQQDYINHIHDHGGLDKGRTIGWLPTCECGVQETEPCRVLDPFSGAGTTALVCERLGLDSIGIDTSAEYIRLAEDRLAEDEQKRIDEQIKQLRKEAKLEAKLSGKSG